MKGCDNYSATTQLYLDKELRSPYLEEFRVHLIGCEACQARLEAEETFSAVLRRSRPLYFAPGALRERIAQAAEPFRPTIRHAPAAFRKHTTVLSRPLRSGAQRVQNWGVLVASLVLVAGILLLVPRIVKQLRAESYIEAAVATHRGLLDGNLPLEIRSESPSVITAWFAAKVSFPFRLPNSVAEPGLDQVYRLTGGRLVNYRGGHAALVAYQMQQQKISLLVSSSSSAVAAGGEEVASGGLIFHHSKHSGFNIITWSNHGLTYALVSSLPGSGRQSCLVCHQSMVVGAHLSAH